MASVSVREYNTLTINADVKEELIRYCELKRMGLPTADVFRRTKQYHGYVKVTSEFTFDYMQAYFEKTRFDPYGDLINLLKQC